jgi:S-adenosylmethionine hydrolase
VLADDAFGNAITSLGRLREDGSDLILDPWLPDCAPARLPLAGAQVTLEGGRQVGLAPTFAAAAPGQALAYIGSSGLLEIAVNQGHAFKQLGLAAGQSVRIAPTRRASA